jgi:hypothetical protein
MMLRSILLALIALDGRAAIDFSHQVVPILKQHCAECHLGEKKKGGLSMNTRKDILAGSENGSILEPGKADHSKMIEVLLSADEDTQMPPKGARLTKVEIDVLKGWINEGLAWEEGYTFGKKGYEPPLKPRKVVLPPARDGRSHPIDRILDKYLADHQKQVPAPADDATFIRRLSMDLIGLPPDPASLATFTKDSSPEKRDRMIAQLLARDVDYAEHWLTFWNDLLRNDYAGTGYVDGGRKQITNWLYQALVSNKPFDQFTRELIAPTADNEGFINGIQWRGNVNASQVREIQFAQSISQVFLGINMKCASCHDSFIDRWKLDEAYGLAAIYSERPLEINRCDKPTGRMAKAAWIFPELGDIQPAAAKQERLKQLAALMTHKDNGRFTRTMVNRLWHRLMGHGIVHPVDAMNTEPWSTDLLDWLASDFSAHGYDLKHTLAVIASSQAYQARSITSQQAQEGSSFVYSGPIARRLTAEQFVDSVWQLTGTGPAAPHGTVLRGKADPSIKPTAKWIWSNPDGSAAAGETITLRKRFTLKESPANAKVVVTADNEYQIWINNKSLGTDNNLASVETYVASGVLRKGDNVLVIKITNGGKGPNPAAAFVEARLRMGDGTYETLGTDSTWEYTTAIPDGKTGAFAQRKPAWQPAAVCSNQQIWASITAKAIATALSQGGGDAPAYVRASLVTSNLLLRSLGRPNREQIVTVRPDNLTTLEAIDLANGSILAGYLKQGAATLAAKQPKSDLLVQDVFTRLLSRSPTRAEAAVMLELVGDQASAQGVEDMLWSVLLLPEFQFVR